VYEYITVLKMGAAEKMYRYSPYIICGDWKVYQYSSKKGGGNPTNMVAEWKVFQYSYKKGCDWKKCMGTVRK
jgi:hypothetical protein